MKFNVEIRTELFNKKEIVYLICSYNECFSNMAITLRDPAAEIPQIIKALENYQKNL